MISRGKGRTRLVTIIALVALLLSTFVLWLTWGSAPPRQSEIHARFIKERSSFEKLRSMFVEDNLQTVGEYGEQFARKAFRWTPASEAGIPESQAETYATLMREAQVKRIDRREDGSISFSIAHRGMANRGWRIQLVSQRVAPTNQLDSLDDFKKSKRTREEAYSPVEDDWYIHIVW